MNTATQAATLATPFVGLGLTFVLGLLVRAVGAGNVVKVAEEVAKDAPVVLKAAEEVEQIPAVRHLVDEAEAAAKAEAERLNAATHGALDVLAAELAKALPEAVQAAVVAAKATVAAQPAAAPATDTPIEAPAALETAAAPAPGAPVTTALPAASAPA